MEDVIFFDMDGTLLDTEKWYTKAWSQALADCGYPLPLEDVLQLRSLGRPFCYEWSRNKLGPDADLEVVRARRTEIMKPWLEGGIPVKPMVCETLAALRDRGYRTAVVTASAEERTRKLLKKTGLEDYFDRIICASMVERGKPAPDIYFFACEQMQVGTDEGYLKQNLLHGECVSVHTEQGAQSGAQSVAYAVEDSLHGGYSVAYAVEDSLYGGYSVAYAVEDSLHGGYSVAYAVEDSPNGVRSAAAAGCRVIMIPDLTQPDAETEKLLWRKAESFAELAEIFS